MDDTIRYDQVLQDRYVRLCGIEKKTRNEDEEFYFIKRVFLAQTLCSDANKKIIQEDHKDSGNMIQMLFAKLHLSTVENVYDAHERIDMIIEKLTTPKIKSQSFFELIAVAKYANFKSLDEAKEFLKQEICYVLTETEENIFPLLHEIKYLDEMDTVLRFLYLYEVGENNINTLEVRDRKKINKMKKQFEEDKKKTIKFLEENGLPTEEVEQSVFLYSIKEKYFLNVNYQNTVKHLRSILEKHLHTIHGTPKRRATKISELIKYI